MFNEDIELCPICDNEMLPNGTCSECAYCRRGIIECPQCETALDSNGIMGECSYCPVCGEPLSW